MTHDKDPENIPTADDMKDALVEALKQAGFKNVHKDEIKVSEFKITEDSLLEPMEPEPKGILDLFGMAAVSTAIQLPAYFVSIWAGLEMQEAGLFPALTLLLMIGVYWALTVLMWNWLSGVGSEK